MLQVYPQLLSNATIGKRLFIFCSVFWPTHSASIYKIGRERFFIVEHTLVRARSPPASAIRGEATFRGKKKNGGGVKEKNNW